ncbi:MAG: PucR family transcriptional regulator [Solirubrobacteraceae bacterium]
MERSFGKIEQDLATTQPWQALDPALAALLLPELPGLADEIAAGLREHIPEYRRAMHGLFGSTVRKAIEAALRQFVEQMGRPAPEASARPGRSIYVELGRGELRAGRGLDALQAAYRLGARIAWRRLASVANRGGDVDPEQLSLLAESIFAYIDELSAESIEGYAREQAARAGERQGSRQHLIRLIIDGAPVDEIEPAARAVAWEVPRALAVLVCDYFDAERLTARVAHGSVAAALDGCCCLLLPDPDAPGRRESLVAALRRTTAALGPTVAPSDARRSFTRARAGLRLQAAGVLPGGRLVVAEEQLATLVLHHDPALLAELADRCLAPLGGLTPNAAERLRETLREWLRWQGSVPDVAAALHVHPQTVRYRLNRLRELFGPALDDPEARFELALATRALPGLTPPSP